MWKRLTVLSAFLVIATVPLLPLQAQKKKIDQPPSETKKSGPTKPGEPKKYDEVITKDAKTYPGVFTVHRVDEKVYFEIPHDGFNKLMLWQAEVVKGPAGVTWGGFSLGNRVLRWDRRGNKVYLWQASFGKRADGKSIQLAVDSANMDSIIYAFNVEAEGKDRSTVINATPLYLTDVTDLSVKRAVGSGGAIDANRSYLEEVKAFPTNIEARSLLTFTGGGGGFGPIGKGPPGMAGGASAASRRWCITAWSCCPSGR